MRDQIETLTRAGSKADDAAESLSSTPRRSPPSTGERRSSSGVRLTIGSRDHLSDPEQRTVASEPTRGCVCEHGG